MKLKNIIQLKDGYRVGFYITDEDFQERRAGLFGTGVTYKTLSLNRFKLEILIKYKVINEMKLNNIEIATINIKHDVFSGYAYFNIRPAGTYLKSIQKKYNLKEFSQ